MMEPRRPIVEDLGECPITLESLSTLPYPPFALYHHHDGSSIGDRKQGVSYFDGLALASYIVSRGVFQNPLTREELTLADCRRLDEYLEDYCYQNCSSSSNSGNITGNRRRKVSVVEAFALRNSVNVGSSPSSNRTSTSTQDAERIQALRNSATAALAGLFVYGNNRQSYRRQRNGSNGDDEESSPRHTTSSIPTDPFLLDWGFDLSRTVDNTAEYGGHGWIVIDDDEAAVVATQRSAYQAVQEAFPPLNDDDNNNTNYHHQCSTATDEDFLERVRHMSVQEQREQERRAERLEFARQQLLKEALERRNARQKQRNEERAQNAQQYQRKKEEQAEILMARAEIEAWREEQWEKLRLLSEQKEKQQKGRDVDKADGKLHEDEVIVSGEDNHAKASNTHGLINDEIAAQTKKAKAAAKRKRAKERKKTLKAEEREQIEREQQRKAREEEKAASTVKCNACGQGILDCGFEKFGKVFCSPKCARTAVKIAN